MPVASKDRCLGFTVQKTVEFLQLHVDVCWRSSSTVMDVPVLMQGRGLQSRTTSFICPLCPTTCAWGCSTDYCGGSAVARRGLLVQFIDGCGRPCAHAGTCYRPVVLQRQGFWSRQCRTLSGGIQVQFFFIETGLAVQTVQKTGDSVVQFWDGR